MAVEAPISRFKKNNIKLYMAICLALGLFFCYDGYLSKYQWSGRYSFYQEHLDANGNPDSTITFFNQKGGPILLGAGIVLIFYFLAAKDRKIVADETELKIGGEESIPYKDIEAIDKTQFASKGFFILNYKDFKGRPAQKKFSDRNWDNIAAVLDVLVTKIS